jgi:outer membrane PBP1 activator LpoA protein
MKKSILVLAISIFVSASVFVSCNSPEKKVENAQVGVVEADKELAKANEEYMIEVEKYKQESADKLAANEKSIAEFKARIATEKKSAKKEYAMKIAALEQKNSDLKKKMDEYKENGKENWEMFKTEFNRDMDEIGNAFKDLTVKNVK